MNSDRLDHRARTAADVDRLGRLRDRRACWADRPGRSSTAAARKTVSAKQPQGEQIELEIAFFEHRRVYTYGNDLLRSSAAEGLPWARPCPGESYLIAIGIDHPRASRPVFSPAPFRFALWVRVATVAGLTIGRTRRCIKPPGRTGDCPNFRVNENGTVPFDAGTALISTKTGHPPTGWHGKNRRHEVRLQPKRDHRSRLYER